MSALLSKNKNTKAAIEKINLIAKICLLKIISIKIGNKRDNNDNIINLSLWKSITLPLSSIIPPTGGGAIISK